MTFSLGARGPTWDAGSEFVGELGDQVVVDPVFHGAEDDDRTGVVHCGRTRTRQGDRLGPELLSDLTR